MGIFRPDTDCAPFGTNATTSVAETESSGAGMQLTVACTPLSDAGQLPSGAVVAVTGSKGPRQAPCNRILSPGAMGSCVMMVKLDRKSTRLNSSHLGISYAVFCLKKK